VIAVSHGIARELCEFYGTSPECVTVVPNGVDHAVFRPAANDEAKKALRRELGLPSGEFLALFVGRDFERKGLRDAIAAIAGVGDARLVVLGPEASGGVERHARRVGAEKQLHFAGFSLVPERYYAACDAFVFPSRYEGFSLANLEAAASGLPIVAHAVNGTDELVVQGENGWLVPPGPDALREKLILLRDDSVELGRLSRGALASALPYGWDDIATRQLRVFEEAAALAADRAGVPAPAVEGALI
jgi:UDP-glucose:(heptosyl)LPS alpha-1,3-glucosyltransferase